MLRVRVVLAFLVSLGMISAASATMKQTELGALAGGDSGYVANLFGSAGTFRDTINFSLTSASSIRADVFATRLTDVSWSLTSGSTLFGSGVFESGRYSFADLAPGAYTVSIFGRNRFASSYIARYAVTAVPEAQTWLMILIGLGLVAFQLRRKHKGLRQPQIAPQLALQG